MRFDLDSSIVRIVTPNRMTAGTGFVVSKDGLVATCAHVVEDAGAEPGGTVHLVFYATKDEQEARVEPAYWRNSKTQDVAILRVAGPLPQPVKPVLLGGSSGIIDHPLRTFGFPAVKPVEGLPGRGEVVGNTTESGFRVLALRSQEITPGFSGAPVIDTLTGRTIGMVTSIAAPDQYGRLRETAFVIPAETLREACPALQLSEVCPYLSLGAFTADDEKFFFGRQRVVDKLLNQLGSQRRFLAVLGPSGSGKSSVVHAGLIPHLKKGKIPGSDRWGIIATRPYDHPFEHLAKMGLTGARESLVMAVGQWLEQHPDLGRLVLVMDQFEEMLVDCPKGLCQDFMSQLAELLDSPLDITVVFIMRDDFYSHFAQQAPELSQEWLPRGLAQISLDLTRDELVAIVKEPAKAVGLKLADGLIARIVGDASEAVSTGEGRTRIANSTVLPLLEFALTELWKRRQDGWLTHEAYHALGGVTGGLTNWANQAYYSLDKTMRPLARRIFTDLVHLGDESQRIPDSLRRRSLAELCRSEEESKEIQQVVQHLADARLLTTTSHPHSREASVEIVHVVLLREWESMQQWLQEDRRFLMWQQQLEADRCKWEGSKGDSGALLHGAPLAEAEQWLGNKGGALAEPDKHYILTSIAMRDQERVARDRRRWITFSSLAFVVVILSFFLLVTVLQWREAETQRRVALSRQLAIQAIQMHLQGPLLLSRALLLSQEALRISETTEARSALLAALQFSPRLNTLLSVHDGGGSDVAFSPDGKTLASTRGDGTVILWDVQSGQQLGEPLRGHDNWEVNSIAFSPNGKILASGDWNGTVILWDVQSRQPVGLPLRGHDVWVSSVAFSPDNKTLALGNGDGMIILWDTRSGQQLGEPLAGHDDQVSEVAFSPDGKTLASISQYGTVILWDTRSSQVIAEPLESYDDGVSEVAFSPDGKTVALGGYDDTVGIITLWDIQNGQQLGEPLGGHGEWVSSLAFSPDGKILASGGDDLTVILWDVQSGQQVGEPLKGHNARISSIAFSPDGKILASGDWNGTVILWDVQSRQPLGQPLMGHDDGQVFSIAFSPDGKTLASGDWEGTVILWDVQSRQPLGQPLMGHDDGVSDVAFSPDNKTLASGDWNGKVILWDVQNGQQLGKPLKGYDDGQVFSIAFSPDGKILALGEYDGTAGTVTLWDVQSRQPLGVPLTGHDDVVSEVTFSPDGKILASGDWNGKAILWDVQSGQQLGEPLKGQEATISSVAFSPDRKTLVLGDRMGKVILWDVQSRQQLGEPFKSHSAEIASVAFSPDGKMLASGDWNGEVILWEVQSGQQLAEPHHADDGQVFSVAFSPNSKTLAMGSVEGWDPTVILWDIQSGQQLGKPLKGQEATISSVAFSPDGKMLASGTDSRTVILWDIQSGQQLGELLKGHDATVSSITFSPDGKTLASGGSDGKVILWDVQSGQRVGEYFRGHDSDVSGVAFSPDGKTLASGSNDRMVMLWDMDIESWKERACRVANRNLTLSEWAQYLGDETYHKTCPNLPEGR
jgi:WD40 repeat protein